MFRWPAANIRVTYIFECECGATSEGVWRVSYASSDVMVPLLPAGWTVVDETAYCPKHQVRVT